MAGSPSITVLMSVHNAADILNISIESILAQTFPDFEFIIVDDGSHDQTADILASYAGKDARIKVISQQNTGLTIALNRGLKLAKGKYIARQDADDISFPERLQKQFDLMEGDRDIVLCGSNCINLYPDGSKTEWGWEAEEILKKSVFIKTPFAHSTAMMRTDIAQNLGGYDESFKTSQDMEFWMRFAKTGKIAMIKTPLLERTVSDNSISAKRRGRQFYDALRARWRHNPPTKRPLALYHSVRSLLINILPHRLITAMRKKKSGTV